MTISFNGSTLTFNDASTQTTAATAATLMTTTNVLSANSGASSKAVGTYADMLMGGGGYTAGTSYSGSLLGFSVGTWRCMSSTPCPDRWVSNTGYSYIWYWHTFLRTV